MTLGVQGTLSLLAEGVKKLAAQLLGHAEGNILLHAQ